MSNFQTIIESPECLGGDLDSLELKEIQKVLKLSGFTIEDYYNDYEELGSIFIEDIALLKSQGKINGDLFNRIGKILSLNLKDSEKIIKYLNYAEMFIVFHEVTHVVSHNSIDFLSFAEDIGIDDSIEGYIKYYYGDEINGSDKRRSYYEEFLCDYIAFLCVIIPLEDCDKEEVLAAVTGILVALAVIGNLSSDWESDSDSHPRSRLRLNLVKTLIIQFISHYIAKQNFSQIDFESLDFSDLELSEKIDSNYFSEYIGNLFLFSDWVSEGVNLDGELPWYVDLSQYQRIYALLTIGDFLFKPKMLQIKQNMKMVYDDAKEKGILMKKVIDKAAAGIELADNENILLIRLQGLYENYKLFEKYVEE